MTDKQLLIAVMVFCYTILISIFITRRIVKRREAMIQPLLGVVRPDPDKFTNDQG